MGAGRRSGARERKRREKRSKGDEATNTFALSLSLSLLLFSNPVFNDSMAAVDVAFKATCATLFATALASGAWLTASMIKGYNDAQEYQVNEI